MKNIFNKSFWILLTPFIATYSALSQAGEVKTLFELAGAPRPEVHFENSILVIIDAQNEYLDGKIPLPRIKEKIAIIAQLLAEARRKSIPIIHVVHQGKTGGTFDPEKPGYQIITELKPSEGEKVVIKKFPNAFAHTNLEDEVRKLGGSRMMILTGFMTHMCVSSTARAALDLNHQAAIVKDAVGTRDLPGIDGRIISAATVNEVSLAELQDRFAWVIGSDLLLK